VCELTRRWDIFLHRRLLDGKGSHESAAQAKISDRNLVIGSPGSPRRNIYSNMQLTPAGVHKFKAITIVLILCIQFFKQNQPLQCHNEISNDLISVIGVEREFLAPVNSKQEIIKQERRFMHSQLVLLKFLFSK
jgi:hypothetical protein